MKKIRVKILVETLRIQYKKYIKDVMDIYMKRMIKDLNEKIFKHHIYTKHYNIVLDLIRKLRSEKTSNIIFNKEL